MIAIDFENVSKQYRLGIVSTKTLSHDLQRWWTMNILGKEDPYLKVGEVNDRSHKGESEYVWALKDINFSIEQGEVLGIIGKNGSGKSTLLKLLSKVTAPTTGTIRARGRIASLLEVGTGFHPEMTGRENIYMNGAIMGMTKAEITRKLDEIVDFSGCERYLDTPVKRYSSGMMVRLGFAVAAHLDPEILVVDEVLAVGDAEFQKKAIGKMQDVSKGEGRTVLFVSHNMFSIRNLCKNGILLDEGKIAFSGEINDTIKRYEEMNNKMLPQSLIVRTDRKGTGGVIVSECYLKKDGIVVNELHTGDGFYLYVDLLKRGISIVNNLIVSVNIINLSGQKILQLSNTFINKHISLFDNCTTVEFSISKMSLSSGTYYLRFYIYDGLNVLDWVDHAMYFTVLEGDFYNSGKIDNSAIYFSEFDFSELSHNAIKS